MFVNEQSLYIEKIKKYYLNTKSYSKVGVSVI